MRFCRLPVRSPVSRWSRTAELPGQLGLYLIPLQRTALYAALTFRVIANLDRVTGRTAGGIPGFWAPEQARVVPSHFYAGLRRLTPSA